MALNWASVSAGVNLSPTMPLLTQARECRLVQTKRSGQTHKLKVEPAALFRSLEGLRFPYPVSSSFKRWSETILCTLGLALAFHLALLKQFSLPCIGAGGCYSVIHSTYGAIFGVPVGYYGAFFWGAAILVPDRTKRGALLALLAAGSVVFMILQFFVLKGFCLYCTAHAVVAWIAVFLHAEQPGRWAMPLGLLIAVGGFEAARVRASQGIGLPLFERSPPALTESSAGAAWLAPVTPRSPALVLSLSCAACVDVLDELSRQNFKDVHSGPKIFFKMTDENRELTTTFVAAVLAQSGSKRDAFLAVDALFLSIKDLTLSSPKSAGEQLARLVPDAASQRDQATQLLAAQTQALANSHLGETTPLLVPAVGRARPIFKLEQLFPK